METKIEDHITGTYWYGMSMRIDEIVENSLEPIDLTGCKIVAEFRASKSKCPDFIYSTEDETILMPLPLTGTFNFKPGIINHKPNLYYFRVTVTQPDGVIVDAIASGTWTIKE